MTVNSREDLQKYLMPDYVDMSALPPPQVIEELDFEVIFAEMLADFQQRKPEYNALLESDPAVIALQCSAYRELLLRHRINEAAKACMLAYAKGQDLDNLAAFYKVKRMVVYDGNPNAIPPILPTYEDDDRLRLRTQLAIESMTTAGSERAYFFHAYSASTKVKSLSVQSVVPGEVIITVLSNEGNGEADKDLINTVLTYLNAEDKRPLTDKIKVQSAEIITYSIKARIFVYPGPSIPVVQKEFEDKLAMYVAKRHKIGEVMAFSGIYESLHGEGVQKVELESPSENIVTTNVQAAYCSNIELEVVVINDK